MASNPKFMQPKSNKATVNVKNLLVSPSKLIRLATINNEGFTFADCFNIDWKLTFTKEQSETTKVKSEMKVNILKPIRFLQGTVVRETEKSLMDAYGSAYFQALEAKLSSI